MLSNEQVAALLSQLFAGKTLNRDGKMLWFDSRAFVFKHTAEDSRIEKLEMAVVIGQLHMNMWG